ncbi:FtsW/RodA/SpoVE family cell cycle protein [Enterococcus timonensis]|uniref:FtsW/RodA/SpoVE family cell cycle protein n=1 Tax=Enterococcus timonensis TaxID=1852364 RepID=UPI0008DB2EA1|nr:FtsW/RodA/SpoVE family cell cycle protein [Enterococcus timonensis]
MPPEKKHKRHYLDYFILIPYLVLVFVGIIMVYSSTSYLQYLSNTSGDSPAETTLKQVVFLLIAFILMAVIYKMRTRIFKKNFILVGLMCMMGLALVATRFTSLGVEVNGAKGWLVISGFSFQPAEYLKLLIVWYLATYFSKRQTLILQDFWKAAGGLLVVVFAMIGLVAIQPDLGGAAILTLLTLLMVISSGIGFRKALAIFMSIVALSYCALVIFVKFGQKMTFIPDYVYRRFAIFTKPFSDALDSGHQLVNGYYAIHNGGWFGRGLGNSIQKKGFLPEAHTDFIFPIVIEELGVIVAILLLLVLFFMIWRMYYIGFRASDSFNSLMMIGIASLFMVQTFVNLGGVLGIIPMTGVTFPFLSQGGNSVLVLSLAVGFALNISADERRKRERANLPRKIVSQEDSISTFQN